MAKNCETAQGGNLLTLNFQKGDTYSPTNSALQKCLKELDSVNQENDLKKTIKEIVSLYTSLDNKALRVEVRNVIIELFTKFNGKKQLKKYVQDLVKKQNLTNDIIKETAQDILQKIKDEKTCDLKKCNEFLHFVSVIQTSSTYDFEENFRPLFPLYISLFDSFAVYASQIKQDIIPEIEELNVLMNAVLKQILPVFVKNVSFLEEIKEQYLQSLLMYSYILLFNEKIGFDLRMKVCLIFVYSFKVLEGNTMSVSQLISKNGSSFNFNAVEGESTPNDYLIIIYSSILSVLPEEKLISEEVDGRSLACVLFEGILETARRNPTHSAIIIETSKTLCLIVKQFRKLPLDLVRPMFLESLFFVSSHADHYIDTVRNYSKIFFEELVALAAHHHGNGFIELTEILIEKIEEIPEESTMRFFAYENIAKFYGCDFLLGRFEHLPLVLLECIDNPTVTEQVCKTYQVLVERSFSFSSPETSTQWAKTWVIPAINVLKSGRDCENFCNKTISTAFKLQPAILRMIFPNEYVGTVPESKVLLHCLLNARKNGTEINLDKDSNLYWRGLIDKQKMEMFMIHQHEEIRILVLASVVESLKSTELFLDWEFIFLINYIRYNITAQAPNVRKQIVSYYKKLLTRYDVGYKVIIRNITHLTRSLEVNPGDRDQKKLLALYQELKKSYRRFICNLTKILIGNLSYDSNFPRRATSLELLVVIYNILTPDEWKSCWTEDGVKNSHNILFDTYESNKKMIVKLLKTLPPSYLGFTNVTFTFKYMHRSFDLALDVKPSKTLSAAYLFDICSHSPFFSDIVHCENGEETKKFNDPTLDMIHILTRKFLMQSSEIKIDHVSMAKCSVYGLILSIRHLLESREISQYNDSYTGVFHNLVDTCFNIRDKIMPVVCNPSPEGYLPDYNEEICDDEFPNAQMVLVYAWRTMKEMTLLLAEIVKQSVKLENQITLLSVDTLAAIGMYFIEVFIQSKHRGVFEQAYVGFSTICESFWKSSREKLSCLPKQWLHEALDLCTGKKHSDDLCATRRSAGLPFLILSILTSEPDPSYFHNTINTLLDYAEDYENSNKETRMHCLNVLRAIFRHSRLGELVAPYVARGVILAITGFKSESWGVRNSSTLLYASLMTRMFGVQRTADSDHLCIKNKLTMKVFFLRYPTLYTFLLRTLAEECQNRASLILQPILMILCRLYPSNFEEGPCKGAEYLPYINVCLSNPVYKTREAAAKASVALINVKEIKNHFDMCFEKLSRPEISDNECHGILLQLYNVLKHVQSRDLPISSYLEKSSHIWDMVGKKFSHMTVNLYTELITLVLSLCRDFDDLMWLKRILQCVSKPVIESSIDLTWQENFLETRTILAYYIIINKFEETEMTYSTIANELTSFLYGSNCKMKKFCLELLINLNQMHMYYNRIDGSVVGVDTEADNHPLFLTEDVTIRQNIIDLVATFSRTSIDKLLRHCHPYLKGFLIEELRIQHYIPDEDEVLLFLLLNYYPCAIRFLRLSKQETLNTLLCYCDCDNEELISAVISCICTFLMEVEYNLLKYDKLLEVLAKCASPAAALHRRLAVCDFLCKNYSLYFNDEPILQGDQLAMVLNIVMVLLEDEELEVRNAMSNFENALKVRIKINNFSNQTISGHKWPVVPEKAKEDLIHLITILLPQEKAVCLIFSWACRYFPDPSCDPLEIFERGGLNQYAENTPLIDVCARVLIKMLWSLPDGLSYDDKSIFLEEQTQVVTTIILNSLLKHDSPMMLTKTKMSVICVLKSLHKFLENTEVSDNFVNNFRTYLNDTILSYLTSHLEHGDLFCVKKIIRKLYDPVFRQRR